MFVYTRRCRGETRRRTNESVRLVDRRIIPRDRLVDRVVCNITTDGRDGKWGAKRRVWPRRAWPLTTIRTRHATSGTKCSAFSGYSNDQTHVSQKCGSQVTLRWFFSLGFLFETHSRAREGETKKRAVILQFHEDFFRRWTRGVEGKRLLRNSFEIYLARTRGSRKIEGSLFDEIAYFGASKIAPLRLKFLLLLRNSNSLYSARDGIIEWSGHVLLEI